MGWRVRGSNSSWGEIFRTGPFRAWGPSSALYNGFRVPFPWIKQKGRGVDYPPLLVPRLKQG